MAFTRVDEDQIRDLKLYINERFMKIMSAQQDFAASMARLQASVAALATKFRTETQSLVDAHNNNDDAAFAAAATTLGGLADTLDKAGADADKALGEATGQATAVGNSGAPLVSGTGQGPASGAENGAGVNSDSTTSATTSATGVNTSE